MFLSAAHCFKSGTKISELYVVLGSAEPLTAPSKRDRRRKIKTINEIESVVIHSKYKGQAYYDISLITLKESVVTSRYIFPICLPNSPEDEVEHERRYGDTVTVTGKEKS